LSSPPTSRAKTPATRQTRTEHLSPSDVAAIICAYHSGSTTRELAEEFAIHRQTVSRALKKAGVPLRAKTRRLDDDQVAEAAERYDQGWTLAQLADHFDVGRETIRRELIESGLTLRSRGGRHR